MGVNVVSRGSVVVVTLDWPQRRNSLGPEQMTELGDALRGLPRDSSVVVLTGNGAFSAGGDLPAIAAIAAQGPEAIRSLLYDVYHDTMRALVDLPVPVLAAIDGPAVGLGMDLALACDWRAIGSDGWLRQGWGELGVIPGTGGELLLRRLAPDLIWKLLGTSMRIGPEEADHLGLAETAPAGALASAEVRAAELAALPRQTLEGYVRLSREDLRLELEAHLEACLELQVSLLCSPEFRDRAERILGAGSGKR